RLLAEAERRARTSGVAELYTDASITARPFFERRGFRVEREQRQVRSGAELVNFRMRKRLGEPDAPEQTGTGRTGRTGRTGDSPPARHARPAAATTARTATAAAAADRLPPLRPERES
ncbi:GNAT family N-acetyltransferase, partial [Leucobacter soli]|uniref:GNAT family N-acetyltransferase n=1 Tax=Leucobacter soli TaxID=2812850 RepID=UPI003612CAA5